MRLDPLADGSLAESLSRYYYVIIFAWHRWRDCCVYHSPQNTGDFLPPRIMGLAPQQWSERITLETEVPCGVRL
jgi:hypothetical protein